MFGTNLEQLTQQMKSPLGSQMSVKQISMDEYMKNNRSSIANTTNGSTDTSLFSNISNAHKRGIIPRCISDLFAQIKKQNLKVTIFCSFLQIYNEKLYDLLQDTYTRNPLQIREDRIQGIYVEGLTEYIV